MRKKTSMVKLSGIILFIMFLMYPFNAHAFDGLNNNPGSHMELTGSAFIAAYQAPSGEASLARKTPVIGLTFYRYEPCRAVNILADASRDTDLFFFGLDYPHAQTPDYNYKKNLSAAELEAIESEALAQYFHFMTDILAKARRLYETGNPRDGLYWLGFFMHGYEDLFAHKGITNAQHGWLGKKIQNPDAVPESIQDCRESLPQLALNLSALLGDKAGDEFKKQISSDADITIPSKKEREKIVGRKHDILWEGIKYKLTSLNDSSMRYIRQISWDYKVIAQILISSEAMDELAAIKDPEALKAFLEEWGYDFQVNYVFPDKLDN